MTKKLIITESSLDDLAEVMAVERAAFDSEEEAKLVKDLLHDPSAQPILSLLARVDDQPVGHIIFTCAYFDPPIDVIGAILGPLAVIPTRQKEGIGGRLIQTGLDILRSRGVNWVFVLGHASYYPKFGFTPAQKQGFDPAFPIPKKYANAWMAMALTPTPIAAYQCRIIPADTFNDRRYWGE